LLKIPDEKPKKKESFIADPFHKDNESDYGHDYARKLSLDPDMFF